MRVVIIGGKGMIGQALANELARHEHQVTILTRSPVKNQSAGKAFLQWDGQDDKKLALLLNGQEAVVNLAGESIGKKRWTKKQKSLILSSRVEPGNALVKALASLKSGPRILLQASAVGFYGPGEEECDETSASGKDWLASICQQWEGVLAILDPKIIRLIKMRSGIVLSRAGGVLAQMALPVRFFAGGPIGNGRQWISWIHIQDEIRAMRFLLEHNECEGVYNLSAPNPIRNFEMEKSIARALQRPYWLPIPAFALKVALGEMSTLVLEGQRVLPVKLLQAGFNFEYDNIEVALKELYQ